VRESASRGVSKGETMSMLSFGVILASLVFNIVVEFGLCLIEFSQNVHQVSSRNDNVFK
jgi:hypothetical protein